MRFNDAHSHSDYSAFFHADCCIHAGPGRRQSKEFAPATVRMSKPSYANVGWFSLHQCMKGTFCNQGHHWTELNECIDTYINISISLRKYCSTKTLVSVGS